MSKTWGACVSGTTLAETGDAPSAHASSHKNGGADEVATATPGANEIPKAGGGGTLAAGWLPGMVGDSGAGGTKGAVPAPAAGDAAAGKYLKADGTWAAPSGALDINGLTAEAAPATGDAVPIYDASAAANRKVTLAEFRALMAEHVAQVRLQRTSSTGVQLLACGGGLIEVNGEIVDVGAGKLCQTSDNLLDSAGANAGAAMGASTIYYLYMGNSLASYQPSQLKASATAPTGLTSGSALGTATYPDDFYLATSGNGRNWRFVGMVRTDGSTLIVDTEAQRLVESYYNPLPRQLLARPGYSDGNSATSFTTTSTNWARANSGTGSTIEFLSFGFESVILGVRALAGNSGAGNATRIGIGIDSTTSARIEAAHNGGTTVITLAGDYVYTPSAGYHYAEFLVCVSAGTGTYYVDDARNGSSADPYASYLFGTVRC